MMGAEDYGIRIAMRFIPSVQEKNERYLFSGGGGTVRSYIYSDRSISEPFATPGCFGGWGKRGVCRRSSAIGTTFTLSQAMNYQIKKGFLRVTLGKTFFLA